MIKTAIIGLGKMGISHCAIANANPDVNLIASCETSSLVIEAFKQFNPKIKIYSDITQLIENEKPDAVIIATPTKLHYPMVKTALENNCNVFCEKPFTLSNDQGVELALLAESNGLVNQVGYHNHFIGTFRELKRLLNNNVIGELVHFTGEAYGPVVTKEKSGSWRSNKNEGGGCLYDYASHVLNLIQEIIGKPVKASGTMLKNIYSSETEDAVYTNLYLESGLSGNLSVNWSDETFRKMSTSLTLQGKKGKIVCDATEIKIYLKEENKSEKLSKGWTIKYITDFAIPVSFYLRGEEYSAQLDYFFENIKNKTKGDINSFKKGAYTDKVIELIYNDFKN